MKFAHGPFRIRHIHQAKSTKHHIERAVAKLLGLCIHPRKSHIGDAPAGGSITCRRDHLPGYIRADYLTAGTHMYRSLEGQEPGAAGNIENAISRLETGQL